MSRKLRRSLRNKTAADATHENHQRIVTPREARQARDEQRSEWILQLQRQLGNQAVSNLLQKSPQRQPGGASVNDTLEREARKAAATGYLSGSPISTIQNTNSSGDRSHSTSSPTAIANSQSLAPSVRRSMEARLGGDFSRVRVHTDMTAAAATVGLGARAFTYGSDIYFGPNTYKPNTGEGQRLLIHELVHTMQQAPPEHPRLEKTTGSSKEASAHSIAPTGQDAGDEDNWTEAFPWVGRITGAWSAALRRTPEKRPQDPHRNTVADLPIGTYVTVTGHVGRWMHLVTVVNGEEKVGYVSRELIKPVAPGFYEFEPEFITGEIIDVPKAFNILKRAERAKATRGESYAPSPEDQNQIEIAISALERTGKYIVDRDSYQVSFAPTSRKGGRKINTIEDFILFVETVERAYPSASPADIASEVRQIWFSDINWEVMVASQGIREGEEMVDIETPPNKIAVDFDMKDLAPESGGRTIKTPMGHVEISHVLAGIDAVLSGSPKKYPKKFLEQRGHAGSETEIKYKTLREASGGDVRDFATWAGDLGQAYAEYLVARRVKEQSNTSLSDFMKNKAPEEELLADIHGYIASELFQQTPETARPGGSKRTVSGILRTLYLVEKDESGTPRQYITYFKEVSGKSDSELKAFIKKRAIAFARPWFAKKAVQERGKIMTFIEYGEVTTEATLEDALREFDKQHKWNENNADKDDKLDAEVEDFINLLKNKMP